MVISGLLFVSFITMSLVSVKMMDSAIYYSLPLKPYGISLTLDNWLNVPFPIITKFYFFNITNPDEVLNESAKPILKELGKSTQKVDLN